MSLDRSTAIKRASYICKGSIRYNYHLIVEAERYHGFAQITFQLVNVQFQHLLLEFSGKFVEGVVINQIQTFQDFEDGFMLVKKECLCIGDNHISIMYQNEYDKSKGGLISFQDSGQQFLYTYFQPYFANRVFPCFDQPNLKATMKLAVVAPSKWKVISHETPNPAEKFSRRKYMKSEWIQSKASYLLSKFAEKVGADTAITTFPETKPLPTYLFCFCAGNYQSVTTQQVSTVPMTLYCPPTVVDKLKQCSQFIFSVTVRCMAFFARKFDMRFPFRKYDQTFIPVSIRQLKNSAMENAGNVIYDKSYLIPQKNPTNFHYFDLALVLSHQLSHHWFGNCVTMKWWNDLWLSESMAQFMSYMVFDELKAILPYQAEQSLMYLRDRITNGYVLDQREQTHSISASVENIGCVQSRFNGITYQKGACVIKQLSYLMGEKKFYEVIFHYLKIFKWQNANLNDFMGVVRYVDKRNIVNKDWETAWLKTSSLSFIRSQWFPQKQQIVIEQENFGKEEVLRSHKINICFFFCDGSFDVKHGAVIDSTEKNTITYTKSSRPYKAVFINYQNKSFMENVIDPISLGFFLENIAKIADLGARVELIFNIQSMAFLKLLQIAKYVDFLLLIIKHQQHCFIIDRLLHNFRQVDPIFFKGSEGKKYLSLIFNQIVDQLSSPNLSPERQNVFLEYLQHQLIKLEKNCYLPDHLNLSQKQCEEIYSCVKNCLLFYSLPLQISQIVSIIQDDCLSNKVQDNIMKTQVQVHFNKDSMPGGSYFILKDKLKLRSYTQPFYQDNKKDKIVCVHFAKELAIWLFEDGTTSYDKIQNDELEMFCDVVGQVLLKSDIRKIIISRVDYEDKLDKVIRLIEGTDIPFQIVD